MFTRNATKSERPAMALGGGKLVKITKSLRGNKQKQLFEDLTMKKQKNTRQTNKHKHTQVCGGPGKTKKQHIRKQNKQKYLEVLVIHKDEKHEKNKQIQLFEGLIQ